MRRQRQPLPSIYYEARQVIIVCEPHCHVLALASTFLCTFGNARALVAVLALPKAAFASFPSEICQITSQITARTATQTSNDTGNEGGSLGGATSVCKMRDADATAYRITLSELVEHFIHFDSVRPKTLHHSKKP
jgi:hypothetical protein